jgi:serine/threonine protein kinase
MGDYLAEGSFGKVYKGYHRDTGKIVAVKQISKNKMEENELEVQNNEIELLKVIDHPNVVQLVDYFEDPFSIYLVLEHLQGYNLMKFIADKQTMSQPVCKRIMRDIFTGLSYLHEIGIVHRDIKLDNIMMNVPTLETSIEYAIPKLIDFGLATVLMPKETRTEGFGTIAYCSPEIISRKPYTYATDIWSMGVCFYTLLSGFFPFMAYEKKNVVKNILHAKI